MTKSSLSKFASCSRCFLAYIFQNFRSSLNFTKLEFDLACWWRIVENAKILEVILNIQTQPPELALGQFPSGQLPPRTITPHANYPSDNHPLDSYSLCQLLPGQLPPRQLPPGQLPPKPIAPRTITPRTIDPSADSPRSSAHH